MKIISLSDKIILDCLPDTSYILAFIKKDSYHEEHEINYHVMPRGTNRLFTVEERTRTDKRTGFAERTFNREPTCDSTKRNHVRTSR